MINQNQYVANDLLDLNDPFNKRSFRNPRYLGKVMTDQELSCISENKHLKFLPSLFWTAKETAYKLMVKRGLRQRFNPSHFEVSFLEKEGAQLPLSIAYKHHTISTQSLHTPDYIHTWTVPTGKENQIRSAIIFKVELKDSQSTIVDNLGTHLGLDPSRLKIVKDSETCVPYLFLDKKHRLGDFSISHDGAYHAYVINS